MFARFIPPLATPARGEAVLGRRQIYIFPNRYGFLYAVLLLVLLLAAINYGNGLAYALTFLLAALAVVSMLYTHGNLFQLRLTAGSCTPVFVGETVLFPLSLTNDSDISRFGVCLERDDQTIERVNIGAGQTQRVHLPVRAQRRGYLDIPAIQVSTTFPLGILYSWSRRLLLGQRCLIYPSPASPQPLTRPAEAEMELSAAASSRDGDDFTGVREYRAGDSARHIDWRAVARGQAWHVKQFGASGPRALVFDWDTLEGEPTETRLSILCRWVLDAQHQGAQYGLRIPGKTIGVGNGEAHQHRCLMALALFPAGA